MRLYDPRIQEACEVKKRGYHHDKIEYHGGTVMIRTSKTQPPSRTSNRCLDFGVSNLLSTGGSGPHFIALGPVPSRRLIGQLREAHCRPRDRYKQPR